jgi:hypothetical protein
VNRPTNELARLPGNYGIICVAVSVDSGLGNTAGTGSTAGSRHQIWFVLATVSLQIHD